MPRSRPTPNSAGHAGTQLLAAARQPTTIERMFIDQNLLMFAGLLVVLALVFVARRIRRR